MTNVLPPRHVLVAEALARVDEAFALTPLERARRTRMQITVLGAIVGLFLAAIAFALIGDALGYTEKAMDLLMVGYLIALVGSILTALLVAVLAAFVSLTRDVIADFRMTTRIVQGDRTLS